MPTYEYDCAECGPFRANRSLADFERDATCPGCGASRRRALAAPLLMAMPSNSRIAHARNEKSAWSPDVVRREPQGHVHSPSCGHGGRQHAHHGGKPWMVGHSH
jgi:putative FmdB family regulatory protein